MNDDKLSPAPPPLPPAALEREQRRRELQRQQRILQLDERIAGQKSRIERLQKQVTAAEDSLIEFERERAELVAQAPAGAP